MSEKPNTIVDTSTQSKRLEILQKKLLGYNPSLITILELEDSKHKQEAYKSIICEAVKGTKGKNRSVWNEKSILEVSDQVDCLIDLARDGNLLGRTWIGWTPYV